VDSNPPASISGTRNWSCTTLASINDEAVLGDVELTTGFVGEVGVVGNVNPAYGMEVVVSGTAAAFSEVPGSAHANGTAAIIHNNPVKDKKKGSMSKLKEKWKKIKKSKKVAKALESVSIGSSKEKGKTSKDAIDDSSESVQKMIRVRIPSGSNSETQSNYGTTLQVRLSTKLKAVRA